MSGRIYEGEVQYFSHHSDRNELVIQDAAAYNGSDEPYRVRAVYISFDPEIIVKSFSDKMNEEMEDRNGSHEGKVRQA